MKHYGVNRDGPCNLEAFREDNTGHEALLAHLEAQGKNAFELHVLGLSAWTFHYNGASVAVQYRLGTNIGPAGNSMVYRTKLKVVAKTQKAAKPVFNELERILLRKEPAKTSK